MLLCWFQVAFGPHRDTMMRRTVWFSLFCMIGLALLVSVRALSPFAGKATPKTPDSFATEDTPLAIKSDRLVAADDEIVPDRATVKTVKVAFLHRPPRRRSAWSPPKNPMRVCGDARTINVSTKRGIGTSADAANGSRFWLNADNYRMTVIGAEE
jgi:hypothetical protein